MKKPILILTSLLLVLNSYSQITKKGVIKSFTPGLSTGDTVLIIGEQMSYGKTRYFVQAYKNGIIEKTYIPEKKIALLPDSLCFWENIWFNTLNIDYQLTPNKYILSSNSEEKLLGYLGELESNNKFYDDPYVEDYIYQLIYRIYPKKLILEEKEINITPKLINDPKTKIKSLANGFLLIGIDFLAKQKTEEELMLELTKGISHIVLRHGTININQDTYNTNPFGWDYTENQSKIAENVAKKYINSKKEKDFKLNYFITDKELTSKLSGIINYVAWQEYYSNHYENSINLLDRLINNDLAVEETYFLKAKIIIQNQNTYQSNTQALDLLYKAEENSMHGYMDLFKEKGLVLLRLGKVPEAYESFLQYRDALNQQEQIDPVKIKWCNSMIYKCSKESNNTAKLQ